MLPSPALTGLPVAEAALAIGARMPTGRAIVDRAAAAIGAAMPAPTAATRDVDDGRIACGGERQRRKRHGLGGRHREQAEAERERGGSKEFHGLILSLGALGDAGDVSGCAKITRKVLPSRHERPLNCVG